MSYFHKFLNFLELFLLYQFIAKNYLPLLQQITDSLKKIGVVETLALTQTYNCNNQTKNFQKRVTSLKSLFNRASAVRQVTLIKISLVYQLNCSLSVFFVLYPCCFLFQGHQSPWHKQVNMTISIYTA